MKAEEGIHSTLTTKTDNIIGCYGDVTDFTEEELEALDAEGRTVITQHRIRSIFIFNIEMNALFNIHIQNVQMNRQGLTLIPLLYRGRRAVIVW